LVWIQVHPGMTGFWLPASDAPSVGFADTSPACGGGKNELHYNDKNRNKYPPFAVPPRLTPYGEDYEHFALCRCGAQRHRSTGALPA